MKPHAVEFIRSAHGSSLIEFALIATVLATVFAGIADYALTIQEAMQLTEAAAAGAVYGTVPANVKDFTGMQNAAKAAAPSVSNLVVTASNVYFCTPGGTAVTSSTLCSGYGTPIEYVQVKTSATAHPILAYTGIGSGIVLNATASYRVQWTK